jgi:hypothetical protein
LSKGLDATREDKRREETRREEKRREEKRLFVAVLYHNGFSMATPLCGRLFCTIVMCMAWSIRLLQVQ